MNRKVHLATLVVGALVVASFASAQSLVGLDRSRAHVARSEAGQPLAAASRAAPEAIVAGYLRSNGRTDDVLASLRVAGTNAGANGVTHLRMEQQIGGVAVHGAYLKAAINARGELVQVIDRLVAVSLASPSRIDAPQALEAAMARLHPSQAAVFRATGVRGNSASFDGGAFFHSEPTVTAVALPLEDGTLARGWLVQTWTADANQLHHTVIDGEGHILDVESRTANDSYNVFVEDPSKGPQAIVNGPDAGNAQSPAGWLAGSQTTINITGNNANAYLDADSNNRADRGGTSVTDGNFVTAADLGAQPSTTGNRAVAVQNLFYLNNVAHDTLYRHGFTEAAGNFQVNNFGLGGAGGDPVLAEAQDGGGTDNANFATPADGSKPRMQMYLWSSSAPSAEVIVGASSFGAYPSAFGPALTTTGVTYPLAVASPSDACMALTAGSLTGKMAIVDRGTCAFTVKVLNAQNAGAKAVLIANNVPGAFGPGGTDRKVKIPSAMVTQVDGITLKGLIASTGNLRKKSVAPLMIDGDLDADIVFHEYGHGLTWRMIGGMSGALAGAVGEGASDVNAFLINGDDRIGEYAYGDALGIRRYPYAGYPLRYGDVTGAGVHADGEIYAGAMWRVLENYRSAGLTADDLHGDFVDGMNFTPATPAFEDMRDGMLASVGNSSPRACLIWRGFAAAGIGVGASGVVNPNGTVTITESLTVPTTCL